MRVALGLTQDWPVLVVGAGNLGRALANYDGFGERGFPVVGLVDADPLKVGSWVGDFEVRSVDDLPALAQGHESLIGVIATPAAAAQAVADQLVAAGVTAILNFAPVLVNVPDTVAVRKVDLALELQILSFYRRLHEDRALAAEIPGLTSG
jgi:redox-sensing transcriptional repressor